MNYMLNQIIPALSSGLAAGLLIQYFIIKFTEYRTARITANYANLLFAECIPPWVYEDVSKYLGDIDKSKIPIECYNDNLLDHINNEKIDELEIFFNIKLSLPICTIIENSGTDSWEKYKEKLMHLDIQCFELLDQYFQITRPVCVNMLRHVNIMMTDELLCHKFRNASLETELIHTYLKYLILEGKRPSIAYFRKKLFVNTHSKDWQNNKKLFKN